VNKKFSKDSFIPVGLLRSKESGLRRPRYVQLAVVIWQTH